VLVEPPQSVWPSLASLAAPLLVVVSGKPLGAPDAFRRAVPRAELCEIRDSGHDLLADAPEQTIELVAGWLAAQSA
jgi:pimeloyl-ACP methyl ester carboxylesterase